MERKLALNHATTYSSRTNTCAQSTGGWKSGARKEFYISKERADWVNQHLNEI